jgi:putative tryptophan/tyrosine transport system substrate-binding protein
MKRRDFITLLGGASAAWPLTARAQQPDRMRRIGVLMAYENGPLARKYLTAFRQALQEKGWGEGRNIRIDERWSGGDADRLRVCAAEMVSLKPDVILAGGGRAMAALKPQTREIPIVFEGPTDPVRQGFVASMARPGGNMTGFSSFEVSIVGKLLEALKEIAPHTARVALMFHPDITAATDYLHLLEAVAPSFSVKPIAAPARDPAEIERAIDALAKEPNCALMLAQDVFMVSQRDLIVRSVATHRSPAVYPFREYVMSGGLLSYGADTIERYQLAASYVDRILRGEKPADLPVQLPTKFSLTINANTAKALGLTVPDKLLVAADCGNARQTSALGARAVIRGSEHSGSLPNVERQRRPTPA